MKCDKSWMRLYAVTDRSWTGKQSLIEQIEDALKGGITCLQLREKSIPDEEFIAEAVEIKKLCNEYRVPFIINDRVDICLKVGADGVHLGQGDGNVREARETLGEGYLIGVSAHNKEEAIQALKDGADYLGSGAAFGSSTKTDANAISHETLREVAASVDLPVVAIGGITKENMLKLKGLGLDGVALVSAIFKADDIEKECRELFCLAGEVAGA